MAAPLHSGRRRSCNLQKFNAETGRLIWSRQIHPPFWVRGGGQATTRSNAIEVEPVHGTDDVYVLVKRPVVEGDGVCQYAIARVSEGGDVIWWFHPTHGGIGVYASNPPVISIAAMSNGNLMVSLCSTSARLIRQLLLELTASGSGTYETVSFFDPVLPHSGQYDMDLFELPNTNEIITQCLWDIYPDGIFQTVLRRTRTTTSDHRIFSPINNQMTVLAVGSDFMVSNEYWYPPPFADASARKKGIVVRNVGGTSFQYTAPPQSDILADNMAATSGSFWIGQYAAIYNGTIYVKANYDGNKIVKFDSSLAVEWQVATDGDYWKLLADEHGVIAGHRIETSKPWPTHEGDRVFWIERRDTDGNQVWCQDYGSYRGPMSTPLPTSTMPHDMCLSDDGSLYVAGHQVAC